MALTNFSLPFGALAHSGAPWSPTVSPLHPIHQQLAASTNNLLYSPADHQQQSDDSGPPPPGSEFFKNNPYAPPQQTSYQYNSNNNNNNNSNNGRRKNTYLPPIPPPGALNTQYHTQQQQQQQQQQPPQQFKHHFQYQQQQHQQQHQFSHINTQRQQQQQQHLTQNNNNNLYKTAISSSLSSSLSSSVTASAAAAAVASSSASVTANANTNTRTYGEGTYTRFPQINNAHNSNNNNNNNNNNINKDHQQQQQQFFNTFSSTTQQQQNRFNTASSPLPSQTFPNYGVPNAKVEPPANTYGAAEKSPKADNSGLPNLPPTESSSKDPYPDRPPGFTRVQAGQGSKTRVHAVLDYDLEEGEEEDYYDADDQGETISKDGSPKTSMPVTPIQGPIYLKNGTVPVVPLFHYPSFNNGSFVQIPIWWTALSVALGLGVRGDVIKGVPCVKRHNQLFCPTAGNSYPIDKIERFIDENKALMRRMYGDFEMDMSDGGPRQQMKKRKRRFIDEPDMFLPPGVHPTFVPDDKVEAHTEEQGESYFGKLRNKRQTNQGNNRNAKQVPIIPGNGTSQTGRLDSCESKLEVVTPYWASNSAGKIRAIVNTQHFEQAVYQEICSKEQTSRCKGDCGCEQKYKWHRLLAYDPDSDCRGIFMDWFLFPSCCVCRCNP